MDFLRDRFAVTFLCVCVCVCAYVYVRQLSRESLLQHLARTTRHTPTMISAPVNVLQTCYILLLVHWSGVSRDITRVCRCVCVFVSVCVYVSLIHSVMHSRIPVFQRVTRLICQTFCQFITHNVHRSVDRVTFTTRSMLYVNTCFTRHCCR